MKKELADLFINWISITDPKRSHTVIEDGQNVIEENYPNSIEGLNFLLKYCSCVGVHENKVYSIPPDKQLVKEIGRLSDNLRIQTNHMVKRHEGAYQLSYDVVFDFEPILDWFVMHTLKRIPEHEVEKFLLERI